MYVLRACSLLVIPPPAGSAAPQGGFPTDLTGINLSDWATLVQDVVAGLQALPPGLRSSLGLQVLNFLQLLEAATGVGFCHFCCNLEPHCRCVGVSQLAPPMSWSQIAEQTPGYGVTASSSGVTTPSTSLGGMFEYVAPPPGLSIWNMPPLEASLPKGPVVSLRYRPPVGRAAQLRAALSRQAPAPQAPQMAPPIHQPLPFPRGWPATPYQQAVQPPGKSSGLGVTFDSSATKPATTGNQDANVCSRQGTQGRDNNSRPASHSQGARERSCIRTTSKQMPHQVREHPSGAPRNVPPASTPESTPPQHGGGSRAYYKHNYTSFKEAEWTKLKDKFFERLVQCQDEWKSIKENHPLQYMPYMEKHFHAATGMKLKGLKDFTGWIKCGSYHHAVVARKGQLHKCPHLAGVELPRWLQVTPSESRQVSQRRGETPMTSPHMPSKEASTAQGAPSDIPAPMETGGVGDGRSWVDRAEASTDDKLRRDRPAKHRRSASRRWEGRPTLPFPL